MQQQLKKLQQKSSRVLFRCKTIFPFTLFQDKIEVTPTRVSLVYGTFFWSAKTFPILITDIVNARVHTNPFFGALEIEIFNREQNPAKITFLRRKHALQAKQIIIGLVEAKRRGLHLTDIPITTLRDQLLDLGSAETISQAHI